MKDPHAQRTPEETDRKNLTSHGAAFEQGEDASPELERIWNAMQPKLAIIDQTLEALARYQARSAMRRKVKRTLLLVACALLVCGCALAMGIKLWDLKVGVIDGTLAIFVQRNQNESTLQREAGTGWGDALDQALVEHDVRVAMPKWIPEGFELADIIVDDAYEVVRINARYEKGEDMIVFSIIQTQEGGMIDAFYEMNEESLRTETVGNLEVYFFDNSARNSAAWHEDEYLVAFSGDISEQEVEKMVQSIFEDEGGEP
ncbi:MAG TPA: DUF4367 domain-containing protein [Candidatus Ornithocaccomicrobium faecavium]|uniref:DUF4367 domain-containing protein n=1 Tax=Candidatus Ornithocaccomicrobium faecavium TaxID=2840890 RepID=A0A9D1P810_9FIRM|nr:DUF4367 domain-containing protein [Clostridiales bacterium]HIV27982.1 DUF4367 domain-containing protein [Candidatus Ornithocaccomicrobium faecavium]